MAVLYSRTAIKEIDAYLAQQNDPIVGVAAAIELRHVMERLAAEPGLGAAPPGPFETRLIYPVYLESGDRRRLAHVAYRVVATGDIEILRFAAVPV